MNKLLFVIVASFVETLAFAGTPISGLPTAMAPAGTEIIPGVQSGITVGFTVNQLSRGAINALTAVDTGAANAYVLTTRAAVGTASTGQLVQFTPAHANTGASVISFNGSGSVAILGQYGAALTGGELSVPTWLQYTGSAWQIVGTGPTPDKARTAAEIAQSIVPTNYYYAPYTMLRYGVDPTCTTDSTTALQKTITAAQAANYAIVTVGTTGACILVGSAWIIDTNKTGIDFQGAFVNASAFTTGHWLTIQQSASDVNQRPMLNAAHPIKNATWQGPGQQNTTAIAEYIADTVSSSIAGIKTENIGFQDWGQDVYEGQGAFANKWVSDTFAPTTAGSSGAATTYSINRSSATNSGEADLFLDCWWYNKAYIFTAQQAAGDTYIVGSRLDFFTRAFNISGSARVTMTAGHMESPFDTDDWGFVTGANSFLSLNGVEFSVDTNKNNFDLFWSDSSATNGGVFIDGGELEVGSNTWSKAIVGGGGNARVRALGQDASAVHPTVGQGSLNMLAYNNFNSANYAGDWTLSGGAVRSSAQVYTPGTTWNSGTAYTPGAYVQSGGNIYYCIVANTNHVPPNTAYWSYIGALATYSMSLPATSSTTPTATFQRPARQGQYIQGELQYYIPGGLATGGTFYVITRFMDGASNVLASTTNFSTTSTVGTWTLAAIGFGSPAPAGTQFVQVVVDVSGVSAGTPVAYVGQPIFNLME